MNAFPVVTPKPLQITADTDDDNDDGDSCPSPVYRRPKDSANGDQKDSAPVKAKDLKRFKRYQALGSKSKARMDARRRKHMKLTPYDQFADILSSTRAKTVDTTIMVEFVASIVAMYSGKSQNMAISKRTIKSIHSLIPYYAPLSEDNLRFEFTDYNQPHSRSTQVRNVDPAFCFAVLPPPGSTIQKSGIHRYEEVKAKPLVMGCDFEWSDLPDSSYDRVPSYTPILCAAILRAHNGSPICVYGTDRGLYGPSGQIVDTRIDVLWRQNDHLFALCAQKRMKLGSNRLSLDGTLYRLSLDGSGDVKAELIFKSPFTKGIDGYSFDSAYYDIDRERLIVATGEWDVYVVGRSGLDEKFREQFKAAMSRQTMAVQGAARLFYVDERSNQGVFVGTKHIMKVSLEDEPSDGEMVEIYETKRVLKGINFQCKNFIYIYHQRTIVAMEHLSQAGYDAAHILRVYSANFNHTKAL